MKKEDARKEIRAFVRDWCANDSLEHYTSEDVESCISALSKQRPELLEFRAGKSVVVDSTQLVRAWVEGELELCASHQKLRRQAFGSS